MKILLVDDEPTLLRQLKRFLEEENGRFEIEISTSAEEGLKKFRKDDFDAVVSDYKMREMDGLEFLRTLREDEGNDIPFLILTGKGEEEVAMKALNLGANRYMQKGGNPESSASILAEDLSREIEHRESEKRLQESEEKYRKLIESSPDAILLADAETGKIIDANKTAEELLGVSHDELVGTYQWKLHPEEDWDRYKEFFQRCVEERKIMEMDIEADDLFVVNSDGDKIPVEIKSSTMELRGKKVVQSIFRSISELRKTQQELGFESHLLNSLLEKIPDSIYFKGKDARFVKVSKSKIDEVNTDEESIKGKTDFDFFPDDQAEEMFEDDKRVIEEEEPIINKEEKVPKPDNGYWWASTTKVPRYNEKGEVVGMLGVSRDITERKKTEQALRKSEEKYRKTIENINVGIVVYGPDREMKILNPRMKEITGYGREDLPTLKQWFEKLYPDEEERNRIKDRWFELMSKEGQIKEGEVMITTKYGDNRTLIFNAVQLESEDVIVFAQDVTKRKKAEERQEFLHTLLRHDLGNKISVVNGYLELLKDSKLSRDREQFLEKAVKVTRDSSDLIEKVRTLRKVTEERVVEVGLNQVMNKVLSEIEPKTTDKEIKIEYEKCESSVYGGPLLNEVFSNILENSIKHSGCERIRVWGRESGDEYIVTIEDDGCGIPEDERVKILEKGFRGSDSSGSGLGMYLVKRIIENYDGGIEVGESEDGGARFDIHLKKA